MDDPLCVLGTCALAGVSTRYISCRYQGDAKLPQGDSRLNWDALPGLNPLWFFRTTVAAKFGVFPILADIRNCTRAITTRFKKEKKDYLYRAVVHMAWFLLHCNLCSLPGHQQVVSGSFPESGRCHKTICSLTKTPHSCLFENRLL